MELVLMLLSGLLIVVMATTAVMVVVVAINFLRDRRRGQVGGSQAGSVEQAQDTA